MPPNTGPPMEPHATPHITSQPALPSIQLRYDTGAPVSPVTDIPIPPPPQHLSAPNRLNLHPFSRLVVANIFAFSTTSVVVAIRTLHTASLQFRAENAHRLPKSTKDWYFYHRSKNYYSGYKAISSGVKSGWGMCGYVSLFVLAENAVDNLRGGQEAGFVDAGSTAVAGGLVAGWFGYMSMFLYCRTGVGLKMDRWLTSSLIGRLPWGTKALVLRKGLWYGFLYGVAQDAMVAIRGGRVWYVDAMLGRGEIMEPWRQFREKAKEEKNRGKSLQEDGK